MQIPDEELWRAHERCRERLVAWSRQMLKEQLLRRGAAYDDVQMAEEVLDPEALTIGFARRFATYKRGALLPVLHMAQDVFGYVPLEVQEYVAGLFGLPPSHVHEVVSFYTLYFQQPKGRHVVAVCHNLSCYLAGSRDILAHVKQRLGIGVGETTDDGRVTLQSVECLCACEAAPMMQVDDRYELNLTPEKVDRILQGLR